ncbi:MAG: hypothetical protein RIT19_1862 [Verrucomicrobiota bacterium]|jgi:hypothetical protein
MEPAPLECRRATVEDLEPLRNLWSGAGLPADELGKFLHEFQVVTDPSGRILYSVGLLPEGGEALLHSEALESPPPPEADACRALAWRRLGILSRNQGITRIWTREDSEYWDTCGFDAVAARDLPATLPSFVPREDGWRVHRQPEPAQTDLLVKRELALWKTQREQEAENFQRRVRTFRTVALGLFGLSMILLLALLFKVIQLKPDAFRQFFR